MLSTNGKPVIMREIRIFSEHKLIPEGTAELTGAAARHIAQVLRLKPGQELVLFDGSGPEFAAVITSASKQSVAVEVGQARKVMAESPLP